MASHQQDFDLKVLESSTNDGKLLELRPENHEDEGKNLMKESSTNVDEAFASEINNVHRLTILNHPEEVPQSVSEIQGNNEAETYKDAKVISPRTNREDEKCEFLVGDSSSYKLILPWVNGDGTINEIVYKGLVRRVLGIVMQNPGILEEHVLSQMTVLNPQSCRKLLELMILDGHIVVRKMHQSASKEPPAILGRLLGRSLKKPTLVCREHFFANPMSIGFL